MLTRIHVNQHNIKANRRNANAALPVMTAKDYKQNRKGHTVIIRDDDGNEVIRFVYRPDSPLPCGAHVWAETKLEVEVI